MVFLLHTPLVQSADPEDLKVNSLSLLRDLTKNRLISGYGYSFYPDRLSAFELYTINSPNKVLQI